MEDKKRFSYFRTSYENEVIEHLEKWRNNGWNINNFFINITHGPGGFRVFYDTKLDENPGLNN